MPTKRIHFLKGQLPGDQAQEWMTDEDWKKFDDNVAELKRTGEYLKPDYIDVSYNEDDFKAFELPPEDPNKPYLSNFGFIIPMGDDGCKILDENGEVIIPKWDWPEKIK